MLADGREERVPQLQEVVPAVAAQDARDQRRHRDDGLGRHVAEALRDRGPKPQLEAQGGARREPGINGIGVRGRHCSISGTKL